ncbi:NifB/NifX family molybdenum-iron cluster-binding protein [Pseudodesulfovibrio senegalensis]|uniref:Dinitrogenase iron-molybdenum cofactor biosynthesis protein n=1 Tax=Pseudodesulfovibrio senegalensis TaxID=1721087 RepID=A0A6N6N5N7_9BACT|nr:NifB/NifX family molybdenum-iron cluster-binding protein [Pseudodesulfovibrio senegalensis]KAB1442795.1 dinitrogenase iron-molybdenum cofactor biosynthesis protein [Pseudodesulfovibrio senegalensis]
MKIAISSTGPDLSGPMDARFGRATGFVIYDTETGEHEYVDNEQNLTLPQGAGIQSAQNVAATGAKAVITGHAGPKAFKALEHGGIAMYLGQGGTVQEAVDAFKAGSLEVAQGPDKEGHW